MTSAPDALAAELRDLYEHAPCGYILTDPTGIIRMANATFLQMTGHDQAALLVGTRFQDLLTVPGRIFYETHYAPLMRMQGRVQELAVDLVCGNGERLPVLLSSTQQTAPDGTARAYRTILFPARDRRRYEDELLRARRRAEQTAQVKAQMLAMLGHEIGTPVTAIALAAQSLARTTDADRRQRYVALLASSAATLQALVRDILDYSRLEAGTMTLHAAPFAVRDLIAATVATVRDRAEEKQLRLEVAVAETVPATVVGDALKIGQILTNLLTNAIKFTARGFVRVALSVTAHEADRVSLRLSVTDSGIGIAPDRLALIFEEFTQASDTIAHHYGGTGLGLTISQRLAALHGSQIEVISLPEVGSTFLVDLTVALAG